MRGEATHTKQKGEVRHVKEECQTQKGREMKLKKEIGGEIYVEGRGQGYKGIAAAMDEHKAQSRGCSGRKERQQQQPPHQKKTNKTILF